MYSMRYCANTHMKEGNCEVTRKLEGVVGTVSLADWHTAETHHSLFKGMNRKAQPGVLCDLLINRSGITSRCFEET